MAKLTKSKMGLAFQARLDCFDGMMITEVQKACRACSIPNGEYIVKVMVTDSVTEAKTIQCYLDKDQEEK